MLRVGGLAALVWLTAMEIAAASQVSNTFEPIELRLNRIASDPVMDPEKRLAAWVGGNGIKLRSDAQGLRMELQQVAAGGGLDYRVLDNLTIGFGVLHDDTFITLIDSFGSLERAGWTIAPYVAWSPLSYVTLWGNAGWADFNNTVTTGAGGTGRFDSERLHAMAGAGFHYPIGGWRLGLSARYLWLSDRSESYTTSNGTFIRTDTRNIEQGRATVSVGYDFGGFKPFLFGGIEQEFGKPRTIFVGTRPVRPDDTGFLLGGGIDFALTPFRGTLRYVEETGRNNTGSSRIGGNAKRLELSLELPF